MLSMYKNTNICDFSVFSLKVLCVCVPPKQNHHTFCSYLLSISPKEAAVHLLKVRAETRTVKIGWVNIHSVVLLWSGSRCYPAGGLAEEWALKDEKMYNQQTKEGAFAKTKESNENSMGQYLLSCSFSPWPTHKHQLISIKSKTGIIMLRNLLHKELAVKMNASRKRNNEF